MKKIVNLMGHIPQPSSPLTPLPEMLISGFEVLNV